MMEHATNGGSSAAMSSMACQQTTRPFILFSSLSYFAYNLFIFLLRCQAGNLGRRNKAVPVSKAYRAVLVQPNNFMVMPGRNDRVVQANSPKYEFLFYFL